MYRADTIVACATPGGRGAIAVVRCSGRDARTIGSALFRPRRDGEFEPWRMRFGTIVGPDGVTPIDDGLCVFFPGPNSCTGEDTVEFHCHGSPVVVDQVVAAAIAAGARAAERGEFTRRAVLNRKLDLLQAEAVADLIDSKMAAGARSAWRQLQGALSDQLDGIRSALVGVLAEVEADVDFTDDELPDPDFGGRREAIATVRSRIEEMLGGFAVSRRQREGVHVVFTGRPNAGKSSLVNRLLGTRRMIVSEEPGTTRDVVEEAVDLGGIAFVLSDTAGIRDTSGAAEAEAVRMAGERVGEADLRILVIDASDPESRDALGPLAQWCGPDTIVVLNKIDLAPPGEASALSAVASPARTVLRTSAATGEGCAALAEALASFAAGKVEADAVGISRVRHRAALERALVPLDEAARLVNTEASTELAAAHLRSALAELSGVTSPLDNEEVLDRIFSEFCLGK